MERQSALVGVLGLVAGVVLVGPAVRAQDGGACSQPYPAWFVQEFDEAGAPVPGGPVLGESLDHQVLGEAADASGLDTDLDGVGDAVTWEGGTIVLTRGDGALRIQPPADLEPVEGTSLDVGLGYAAGDYDGDGKPEFSLSVEGGVEFRSYLVLGTVTPGTHRIDEVSVDVTAVGGGGAIGDQDGDGLDDGLAGGDDAGIGMAIVRGVDVVAPGPGGVLTAVPTPIRTIDHPVDGVLDLVDGAPVLASADPSADAERVLIHGPELVELAVPPIGAEYGAMGNVTASRFEGDRIVVLHQGWRNGGRQILWNLDAPCTTFSADVAPTTAPAPVTPAVSAEPTSGAASYTG